VHFDEAPPVAPPPAAPAAAGPPLAPPLAAPAAAAPPDAPPPAAAVAAGPMRWNNVLSGFVIRKMAQLVSDGSRPDKVFKDKDVNLVAKQLKELLDTDHYCTHIKVK